MKILDQAGIELGTPGSAVKCASVVRNVTIALRCLLKLSYEFNRPYKPENKSQSVLHDPWERIESGQYKQKGHFN